VRCTTFRKKRCSNARIGNTENVLVHSHEPVVERPVDENLAGAGGDVNEETMVYGGHGNGTKILASTLECVGEGVLLRRNHIRLEQSAV
jgi:hypothetical protein